MEKFMKSSENKFPLRNHKIIKLERKIKLNGGIFYPPPKK